MIRNKVLRIQLPDHLPKRCTCSFNSLTVTMASLMWTTAFYVLCVEIFLIALCCIPSARWRELVVKLVTSNFFKTISQVRLRLR